MNKLITGILLCAVLQLGVGTSTAAGPGLAESSAPSPVSGRTLTVGPNGQYRTIQAAADVARPGDKVKIAPGTYPGGLKMKRSGSRGKPITFYGDGGRAVVTGTGGSKGLISLGNRSWLRLVNLTSKGSRGFGIHADGGHDLVLKGVRVDGSQDGGLVLLGVSDVLVDRCEIQGSNAEGTSADHEALSIAGSTRVEVRRCRVHDNGEEGIDVKYSDNARTTIHDNRVWNNRGPNIYVDSASFVDVYNNVVSGTGEETKSGIALAIEDYSESRRLGNVNVYNNVSHGNAQAGLSFWVESTGVMSNIRIINNTFYGNRAGAIVFAGDKLKGTNLLRNNILGKNVDLPGFVRGHNIIGNPGFVGPAKGNFHLRPDAKWAIDKGSAASAPAFDLDNRPRPAGACFDIGAYEVQPG